MPEPDFLLLPATWRDLRALRALERACFDLDAWPLIDLVGVLTFPGVLRWKAVIAGEMVGFAAAEVRSSENIGWITTIGVLPEYRRRGIAQALLQRCEQGLRAVRCIRLCVRLSNQGAIALYHRNGYVEVERWPHYYLGGEDAQVMEKML